MLFGIMLHTGLCCIRYVVVCDFVIRGYVFRSYVFRAVLCIRIRMDPELLPGSGSRIKVPDPDPAKGERAYK